MAKFRLTPAAVVALAEGDMENAIAAMVPGGIERQEAEGREWLIENSMLPVGMGVLGCSSAVSSFAAIARVYDALCSWGLEFGGLEGDIFVPVKLPGGWALKASEQSQYLAFLLDDQKAVRAQIFFKAAFYDRRAELTVLPRFRIFEERIPGELGENRLKHRQVVIDSAGIVPYGREDEYFLPPVGDRVFLSDWSDCHKGDYLDLVGQQQTLHQQCEDWLRDNYPKYQDSLAYWEK